jgi:hypothetical protein
VFQKKRLETQRHREHGEGKKEVEGDGIALKVARMFGVGNRWWLGLRGNEKRRECD